MCGEKALSTFSSLKNSGSPPRMRGKVREVVNKGQDYGITPAHAGKSNKHGFLQCNSKDHPRVCGEKISSIFSAEYHSGSPPRMRGKVNGVVRFVRVFRITPAYAGKSRGQTGCQPLQRDHPRVCGEKLETQGGMFCELGSPPHVRGKARHDGADAVFPGITPACAGKSQHPQ